MKRGLLLLLVCLSVGTATAETVQDGIEAANEAWEQAILAGDAAALAALYTPDAIVLAPNADEVIGTEAIQNFWADFIALGIGEANLETVSVTPLGEGAYELGHYSVSWDGGADQGKYIVIWKRQGGDWRLHRDIWNSSLPAAGAETAAE